MRYIPSLTQKQLVTIMTKVLMMDDSRRHSSTVPASNGHTTETWAPIHNRWRSGTSERQTFPGICPAYEEEDRSDKNVRCLLLTAKIRREESAQGNTLPLPRLRRWTMCNSVLQGLSHESGLLSTDVVDWSIFDACCRLSYVIGFSVCK